MSLAYLAGARPDIVTQNGNYAKSNIDVRLYDVTLRRELGRGSFRQGEGGPHKAPIHSYHEWIASV